jgi:hypothetical protein
MDPHPDTRLDAYASRNGVAGRPAVKQRRPRREFIRGPLPVSWIAAAAKLHRQALAVAMAVWFRKGIERAKQFPLYPSALARFGVNRWSGYRALAAMEAAGLVRVERHRGRSPLVTVLDLPDPTPAGPDRRGRN